MSQTDQTVGGTTSGNGGGKRVAKTKVSQNGTTTVPSPIRESEDIDEGDEVEWRVIDGEWVLRPVTPPTLSLHVLEEYEGEPCTECGDGTFIRTERNGTDAVVCDVCETIRGELWNPNQ